MSRYDVPEAFDAGAAAYDGLVGANPGYHQHLRLSAQRMELPDGGSLRRRATGQRGAAIRSRRPD